MYQPPYSVLKPLRYMVGGPSEVYASSGAAVFVRDEPQGHTMQDACSMLMEPHGYDEGCLILIARNLLGLILREPQGYDADVP